MPRDDDRPLKRKGGRRHDRPGFLVTFGTVLGIGVGIGAVVVVIVLAVNKGKIPGAKEELPEGVIDAKGLGKQSADATEDYFRKLDSNVKLREVETRLGGSGRRLPKERHKDVQFKLPSGEVRTLGDWTKEGFDKYQWFAWTNGTDTLLIAFTNSTPYYVRAKVYYGPRGLEFKSVD